MKSKQNVAGLYIRVSTMNQVDKDSLTTQRERLLSYCKAHGFKKHELFRDAGCSAKNTERPSLNRLMKSIEEGKINCVFVTKLDRITRSIKDLLELVDFFDKHGVQFVSISESIDTSNAMGRFMQNLLGILAQLEREMTAERVSVDMHHRARKGKWNGGIIPYGYATQAFMFNKLKSEKNDANYAFERASKLCPEPKKLYVYPEEAKNIVYMFDVFLETNSIRKTATKLNNQGIRTRKNKFWPQSTIHRILKSPIYIGKITYGKRKTSVSGKLVPQDEESWTVVDGEHEAIISEETFNNAQSLLGQRIHKPVKEGRNYLLTGLLKCGYCKGNMTGHTFTKKESNKSYSYYKCSNRLQKGRTACKGLSLPAKEFEDFIISELTQLSNNKKLLSDKRKMIEIMNSEANASQIEIEIKEIGNELKKYNQKLEVLLTKLEDGIISDDDFTPRYQEIKKHINQLEVEKDKLATQSKSKTVNINNLELSFDEICSFGYDWEYLDEEGKSMRIRSIVKEIRSTEEETEIDTFIDVAELSRMARGSWPPPA